jgi:hypothetical protein
VEPPVSCSFLSSSAEDLFDNMIDHVYREKSQIYLSKNTIQPVKII